MLHNETYNPDWNWRTKIILNDYIRVFEDDNLVGQETPPEGLGLLGLFSRYRVFPNTPDRSPRLIDGHLAGKHIEIRTVAPAFSLAIKSKPENLPAVSFGFGSNRGLETGTTEGESGKFHIFVYAEVNQGKKYVKDADGLFPRDASDNNIAVLTPLTIELDGAHHEIPQTVIERAGDMYSCVEEVVMDLRTFCPVGVDIHNVRIADLRTPETKLSEKDFLLFVLEVQFEDYFGEVT